MGSHRVSVACRTKTGRARVGPTLALVLVFLGALPDHEEALYFAAVALLLVLDAGILLMAVFHLGRPRTA